MTSFGYYLAKLKCIIINGDFSTTMEIKVGIGPNFGSVAVVVDAILATYHLFPTICDR